MGLIIITPCTRTWNLQKIKESINLTCEWIIVYDSETCNPIFCLDEWIIELNIKGGISGNLQRNLALDYCGKNDWVYFLDDDNLLHPEFYALFLNDMWRPNLCGILFSQELPDGSIRKVDKDNVRVCCIDQAQYILHMSLIREKRFIQQYEADGIMIEQIYKEHSNKILITNQVLCYYNKLRQNG
jgi:glycosyltransferase involved in cell wall biosynthesis